MAHSKIATFITAGVLCAGLTGVVFAQTAAETLVKQRRDEMVTIGRANGGIGVVARAATATPEQLAAIKGEADKVVAAFDKVQNPALWAAGSGVADNVAGTKAKAEIWSNAAGFKTEMDAAVAAAHALKAATDSGDHAKVKEAQGALQKTCGSCHSKFRT